MSSVLTSLRRFRLVPQYKKKIFFLEERLKFKR